MSTSSLKQELSHLHVTHFNVISHQTETFERVIACLYRLTSDGVFQVLSESTVEGSCALLNTERYDDTSNIWFCVWGIKNQKVVERLGLRLQDLRIHGEIGTVVDGIQLSPLSFADKKLTARTERYIFRCLSH